MLSQLYIKNIAVIREADIEFGPGFNVFTGETGAGKTMLISAINGVLGARLSRDIIRSGEDSAAISALFTGISDAAAQRIEELGYDAADREVLISREIGAKNSCKINGRPATMQILREIASELIDVHGQKDNHRLLDPQYHIEYIDDFGELTELRESYRGIYRQMQEIRKKLRAMQQSDREKEQRIALLQYQVNEIETANLQPGEDEELSQRRDTIRNAERILKLTAEAKGLLDGGEDSDGAANMLTQLAEVLGKLSRFVPELSDAAAQVTEVSYTIHDVSGEISRYLDHLDFDPHSLDEIEDRLELIQSFKRKYGASIEEIQAYGQRAADQLREIQFSQEIIDDLVEQEKALLPQLAQAADELTSARHQAARNFLSRIKRELEFLNMPNVKLTVSADRCDYMPNGQDELELLISSNAGEAPKPLAKIASGGELSRVMLSIKNVLAEKDQVGTAIFDEIDTGVSGSAAQKIGKKLQEVSRNRQVICVTHLAPVAACGDSHLFIHKDVEEGRTYTRVDLLSEEERVREIARIVSGDDITETALNNAREMLNLAHQS
ncbi:MAG: DNA repair protein RecN [Oscillospiraceae bacterium]|nr:DNA repair protein RecN [Oscillospiraceae bacterium]